MKKKTKNQHLLSGLLLAAAGAICFFKADTAYAAMTSAQLQAKFPDGMYWNHAGNPGSSNSVNNQDGYTSTPCSKHGTTGTSRQTCNGFAPGGSQLSWQCMGFAEKLGYDFTGSNPRENRNGWSTSTSKASLNSLKAGDIVRYKNNGHSIFITAVNGDTVTYADCNSDGHCRIRWNKTISKPALASSFTYKRSAPYGLAAGSTTHHCQVPGTAQDPVPSINEVKINGIDSANVNFSFSVNNGTLVKIVIKSTLTGETVTKSYTSGLSSINYNFYRGDIPTGGNTYNIYLYAYSGSAGNYKNEQVHKMTYGPSVGCVTFPDTMDNSQAKAVTFNYKFYADLYGDLKKAYNYNEELLYKHWITYGIKEGRIASPAYCSTFYLKNNGDIASAYGKSNYAKAYFHYTTYGYKEGDREISPVFSAKYYLSKNTDVANVYGSNNFLMAAAHFNACGIYEARNSSQYYFGQYYKKNNGDLLSMDMDSYKLVLHYIQYGIIGSRILTK